MSEGALPTDRVASFLGHAGLAPMPVFREQPIQSAPKKKAQERAAKAAAVHGRRVRQPHRPVAHLRAQSRLSWEH